MMVARKGHSDVLGDQTDRGPDLLVRTDRIRWSDQRWVRPGPAYVESGLSVIGH